MRSQGHKVKTVSLDFDQLGKGAIKRKDSKLILFEK